MKNRSKLIIAVVLTVLLLASTLVFAFASDSVTVSFYDGEKLVADVSVTSGAVPAAPDADEIVLIDGVGYRFLGWTDTVGGTEPIELSAVTGNTTLYAVRTPAEFKVEKANGDVVWYAPGETTLTALLPSDSSSVAGDYITACSDIDIDGSGSKHIYKSFTLDLNGNTLTTSAYFMVRTGAHAKICNGTVEVTTNAIAKTWATSSNASSTIELNNVTVKKDSSVKQFFLDLEAAFPDKVRALIQYDRDQALRIYAATDIFLMPSRSEPCGLSQMIASRYGAIPVTRETGGLYDSIKGYWRDEDGTIHGNGFTFANYASCELAERTAAAIALYENAKARKALVKKIMETDFSWNVSAERYLDMYRSL